MLKEKLRVSSYLKKKVWAVGFTDFTENKSTCSFMWNVIIIFYNLPSTAFHPIKYGNLRLSNYQDFAVASLEFYH